MYEYRNLTPEQRQQLVQERLARGYPPHQPPHPAREQRPYLLTAACYEHRHHLCTPGRRGAVLDLLFEQLIQHGLDIYGWVVLSNHYHVLVDVTEFEALGDALRLVHGRTAYTWNQEDEAR